MIRHNLFYKLLALGVAIILWAYVNSERNPQSQKSLSVPIEVRGLAKGYVADLSTHEAHVTISGLKTVVDSVRKEDVSAWVTVESDVDGRSRAQKIPTRASVSGVARNSLSVELKPKMVVAVVESLSSKRLPVEVKYVSPPPLGYSYGDPQLTPASAKVSGKSTQVGRVKRLIVTLPKQTSVAPIDDYFELVPLDSGGNAVAGVKLTPDRVQLKLRIVEVPATKAVLVSPNVTGEPKYPARVTKVSVTPSSVTLEGKTSALVGLSTVMTDRVSIEGAETTVTRNVTLREPPGVSVVGRNAVRVTVYIAAPQ